MKEAASQLERVSREDKHRTHGGSIKTSQVSGGHHSTFDPWMNGNRKQQPWHMFQTAMERLEVLGSTPLKHAEDKSRCSTDFGYGSETMCSVKEATERKGRSRSLAPNSCDGQTLVHNQGSLDRAEASAEDFKNIGFMFEESKGIRDSATR
ncbi:hypothetical protein RBB50_002911 [Rhinocladiella similis]